MESTWNCLVSNGHDGIVSIVLAFGLNGMKF